MKPFKMSFPLPHIRIKDSPVATRPPNIHPQTSCPHGALGMSQAVSGVPEDTQQECRGRNPQIASTLLVCS